MVPAPPFGLPGLVLTLLLAALVAAWVRGRRAPWSELLYAAALGAFGYAALRNVAPAVLLLAPLAAHRLGLVWSGTGSAVSGVEARRLRLAALSLGVLAAVAAVALVVARDPLDNANTPQTLLDRVAQAPRPVVVLPGYGASGAAVALGGPDVQVTVDGRADLYGREYLQRYLGLLDAEEGWPDTLAELDPDLALLHRSGPLAQQLVSRGWRTLGVEGRWVLLQAPGNVSGSATTY